MNEQIQNSEVETDEVLDLGDQEVQDVLIPLCQILESIHQLALFDHERGTRDPTATAVHTAIENLTIRGVQLVNQLMERTSFGAVNELKPFINTRSPSLPAKRQRAETEEGVTA